jgi:hypothetical protein
MNISEQEFYPDELNAFAASSSDATFYQSRGWLKTLDSSYGRMSLRTMVARDGNDIVGYLPFFYLRRSFVRNVWSLPFGTYGGPVCNGDQVIGRELIAAFERTVRGRGALECGWVDFNNHYEPSGTAQRMSSTHIIDLSVGFDALWSNFHSMRRKSTRKAERAGVVVSRADSQDEIDAYYRIFENKMSGWGNDGAYPDRFFHSLFEEGGDSVRLLIARHDGEIVGGHLNFYFGDMVIAWYNVTSSHGDAVQAGSMLYTHCLQNACEENYLRYNLGGSLAKESLIKFKETLGGKPYEYRVNYNRTKLGELVGLLRGRRR